MRYHDLDAEPLIRRGRPGRGTLLAATFVVITALAGAGTPQAGPQPPAMAAAAAPMAQLPPSSETTGSIGGLATALHKQETAATRRQSVLPLRERHVLMTLLVICFMVLSVAGYAFWRRSIAEFGQNLAGRSAIFGKEQ